LACTLSSDGGWGAPSARPWGSAADETMTDGKRFVETPWDSLPREELLRHVQRAWSTIVGLEECLVMAQRLAPSSEYWGPEGSGGRALEKARQVRASVNLPRGSERDEALSAGYFRYADDLLFDRMTSVPVGYGWLVCEREGGAWAPARNGPPPSACPRCGGPLRPIAWTDLQRPAAEVSP
jgi:hypothetical protein